MTRFSAQTPWEIIVKMWRRNLSFSGESWCWVGDARTTICPLKSIESGGGVRTREQLCVLKAAALGRGSTCVSLLESRWLCPEFQMPTMELQDLVFSRLRFGLALVWSFPSYVSRLHFYFWCILFLFYLLYVKQQKKYIFYSLSIYILN